MAEKLKVVYVPDPENSNPWKTDVTEAVGRRHNLAIYDYKSPVAPQFQGVDVVIDLGGLGGRTDG